VTEPAIAAFQAVLKRNGGSTIPFSTDTPRKRLARALPLDMSELSSKEVARLTCAIDQRAREDAQVSTAMLDELFARRPMSGHESPHTYCHPAAATLCDVYQQRVEQLFRTLGWLRSGVQSDLPLDSAPAGTASRTDSRDPGMDAVRNACETAKRVIVDANNRLREQRAPQSVRAHARSQLDEAMAVYTWLQIGLASAARDARSPAPNYSAYSADHPLALVADKAAHGPDEARIAGLPAAARRTLAAYRRYLHQRAAMLGRLDLGEESLVVPTYTAQGLRWELISEKWLKRVLPHYGLADASANALRHRASTWFAERLVSAPLQCALMNHLSQGMQPFGGHSALSMQQVAATLARVVEQLLHAAGAAEPLDALIDV
jgi:hypothetical protein